MDSTPNLSSVFSWNDNLETGIDIIDQQHRTLINLINKLTHTLIHHDEIKVKNVLDELVDYAEFHFRTEEAIWEQYFHADDWQVTHENSHHNFLPTVQKLLTQDSSDKPSVVIEKTVKFLIRWLAFHIIESDKKMAITVQNIESGHTLSEAKKLAEKSSVDAVQTLIDTILTMYEDVSTQAIELLRERATRLKTQQQLEVTNEKLERLAITDQLTSLYNRRHFEDIFPHEIQRAIRGNYPLTFIMFDIDYFKLLNDNYGHIAGDKALISVSNNLMELCQRPGDYVFRLGGEEFGILATDHSYHSGSEFADRIRASIEALSINNSASKISDCLTISAGVITKIPTQEDTIDDYLRIADERLYQAKSAGRNRVVT